MINKTYFIWIIVTFLIIIGLFLSYENSNDRFSLKKVNDTNTLAKQWLFSNLQREPNLFLYSLDTETGEVTENNNAIRQLMASRVLAKESSKNIVLLAQHKANLDYLMKNWYHEENGFGYVYFKKKSKLGANAMLLRTLVISPYFESYENEARALANGILYLQKDDGSFSAWFKKPLYDYNESYLLTFYSGEAILSLVEYYEKTLDKEYLEAAKLSADFYTSEYAVKLADNYYPAYVPWHTMALNKLYKISPDLKYVDAIFVMNDKLLEIQDTKKYIGRFYNPTTPEYGTPHSSSDAVYTEGLAYAYEIALLEKETKHAETYLHALKLGAQNIISLQFTKETRDATVPVYMYVGAIRIRDGNPWIRVDTAQHTVDAFTKILEVVE